MITLTLEDLLQGPNPFGIRLSSSVVTLEVLQNEVYFQGVRFSSSHGQVLDDTPPEQLEYVYQLLERTSVEVHKLLLLRPTPAPYSQFELTRAYAFLQQALLNKPSSYYQQLPSNFDYMQTNSSYKYVPPFKEIKDGKYIYESSYHVSGYNPGYQYTILLEVTPPAAGSTLCYVTGSLQYLHGNEPFFSFVRWISIERIPLSNQLGEIGDMLDTVLFNARRWDLPDKNKEK